MSNNHSQIKRSGPVFAARQALGLSISKFALYVDASVAAIDVAEREGRFFGGSSRSVVLQRKFNAAVPAEFRQSVIEVAPAPRASPQKTRAALASKPQEQVSPRREQGKKPTASNPLEPATLRATPVDEMDDEQIFATVSLQSSLMPEVQNEMTQSILKCWIAARGEEDGRAIWRRSMRDIIRRGRGQEVSL